MEKKGDVMSQKGVTLSSMGTEAHTANLSGSRVFKVILGLVLIILVAVAVHFSWTAVQPAQSAGSVTALEANAARWIAMGEHFRAPVSDAVRAAAAEAARWDAMGEHYRAPVSDAERAAVAGIARWDAMGEHYRAPVSDAVRAAEAGVARWDAMGERYTNGDINPAGYQKIGE
jgi:uncharacterized membrane protein